MNKLLDKLESNATLNWVVLLIYYSLVVLPHEVFGLWINKIFKPLARSTYNSIIAITVGIAMATLLYYFYKRINEDSALKRLLPHFLVTAILMILSFKILLVINIEAIHFPQYAIFAILAYPLFRNSVSTLFFSGFAGILDELYQYLILAPENTNYFDFNDVFIDTIGAGLGLIFIKFLGRIDKDFEWNRAFRKWEMWLIPALLFVFCVGLLSGHFSIYTEPGTKDLFSLVKIPEDNFWTIPKGPPAKFHVMRPLEGAVAIILLLVFYSRLNKIRKAD